MLRFFSFWGVVPLQQSQLPNKQGCPLFPMATFWASVFSGASSPFPQSLGVSRSLTWLQVRPRHATWIWHATCMGNGRPGFFKETSWVASCLSPGYLVALVVPWSGAGMKLEISGDRQGPWFEAFGFPSPLAIEPVTGFTLCGWTAEKQNRQILLMGSQRRERSSSLGGWPKAMDA